uniref:complement factor H-related protein 1-like n=1 Tax=Semicossyphus pulcher TaxID=241346 RepID=UPI0037E95D10
MSARYLGFVLLIWLPGTLHAQSADQPCVAPSMDGGYFVPEKETYPHKSEITYACDDGLKPAVEGWWASSTCQNGIWSHGPQCIDEKACTPLTIPNAGHTENSNGWFEEGHRIRITCDEGYELKNLDNTAICLNGTWSSVPVCEKSGHACGEPPKIPHAVIIGRRYQEVFARDSKVQYECEDGFTANGIKSIFCLSGDWTEGPTCSGATRPDSGNDGATVGGTGSGHGGSTGSVTRPVGGGSSSNTGLDDRNSKPLLMPVDHCGDHPTILNGDVVQVQDMHLKYQCNAYYTKVGPDTVVCYNDGSWSKLPECKDAFCVVDLAQFRSEGFQQLGKGYVKKEGGTDFPSEPTEPNLYPFLYMEAEVFRS